ncbi:MAG TPA: DUF501 domain-containing protein [Acidimicrobiia bacterium]
MSSADDREVIETQIGRPLRAESSPVSRCHLGLPVVAQVPPLLDDGTPFPTLYWLTCPLATTRIGRLEGAGGVRRMERKAETDDEFGRRLAEAHVAYAAERDALVPTDASIAPSGGVGGTTLGVKCLHAHYAHTRAGGANPIGELVQEWIEPLDCAQPCVVGGEINPDWVSNP